MIEHVVLGEELLVDLVLDQLRTSFPKKNNKNKGMMKFKCFIRIGFVLHEILINFAC